MGFRKLLGLGSQTAPRIADDVVESKSLRKKLAEEAAEEAPEVVGEGSSKFARSADDIPDADFVEVTPTTGMDDMSWLNRMDPRLKAFAKGGAAGGTLGYIASELYPYEEGSDAQIPLRREQKASVPKTQEAIKEAKTQSSTQKATVKTEPPRPEGLAPDAQLKEAEAELDEMRQAQDKSEQNRLMAIFGKAASQIGSGIASLGAGSQVKTDTEIFDDLLKSSDRPISQLKERQAFSKAKDELSDETKMRDPNSEISKMVTSIAQKVGILKPGQSSSAMALRNAGVNLGTLLATIEAGNARRDAAALARETSSLGRQERMEMRAEEDAKKRLDKRKLVTEEIEARKQTIQDNIKRARDLVEKYGTIETTGPEAELLQGMLDEIAVDTAKLQDPDSVARPAEVQLVRKNLIPEDALGRMTMTNATAKKILDEFEKRTNERAAIGYKVRGIQQPQERQAPANNNSGRKIVKQGENLFDANTGEFLGKAK